MRGGARKGAGRKQGTLATRTQEIIAATMAEGITPLEHMLNVVRTPLPTQMKNESEESFMSRCKWHITRQDQMASSAAPYMHPRLNSIETKKNEDQFAEEQKAKIASMDMIEAAKRIAYVFAEAQRLEQPEQRTH